MRYYRPDGTVLHDHPHDTEFGWFFDDIVIDEASSTCQAANETVKEISKLQRRLSVKCENIPDEDDAEESVDVLEDLKPKPALIHKIEPNIKEETPTSSVICAQTVEGFIENPESNFDKQIRSYTIPSKDNMISLISPVNPETKALLSVVSYSKYRSLNDKETSEELFNTLNFKTTNSRRLISERTSPFRRLEPAKFLLNGDSFEDVDEVDNKRLATEIRNYHATKEDNMLSLMMELVNTDMDSNLGDISEINNSLNELNNVDTNTSDLGNSIHSSILSKDGNGSREKKNYLEIPNRSDILSSIGIHDDIDRSIETFLQEKSEMFSQLTDTKKNFENLDKKIDTLMDQASALQQDLRETTYLNNVIHLLKGRPEKVKNKKLPFRIFHQSIDDEDVNDNLII